MSITEDIIGKERYISIDRNGFINKYPLSELTFIVNEKKIQIHYMGGDLLEISKYSELPSCKTQKQVCDYLKKFNIEQVFE